MKLRCCACGTLTDRVYQSAPICRVCLPPIKPRRRSKCPACGQGVRK